MSLRIVARSIFANPGNRGQKAYRLARATSWQLSKRYSGLPRVITLANGRLFRAYPDCVVSSALIYADWPEFHEIRFLRNWLHNGDVLIDVGANAGHLSLLLSDIAGGPDRIFAFEPAPGAWRRLAENWALNGWPADRLFAVAAGSRTGTAFIEQCASPVSTLSASDKKPDRPSAEVPLARIDDYSDHWRDMPIGLLKIDVEDRERDVISGASEHLKDHRIRTVMFESLSGGIDPGIARIFTMAGYRVFGLNPAGRPDFSCLTPQNLFAIPDELCEEVLR